MNKSPRMLYLSGLITEEQLSESSDFEYSMAAVQKMQSEFENIHGALEGCLSSCVALERQVLAGLDLHKKSGMDRADSQGLEDTQYFEGVLQEIRDLARSLQGLFGGGRQIDRVEKSFEELAKRLNADF